MNSWIKIEYRIVYSYKSISQFSATSVPIIVGTSAINYAYRSILSIDENSFEFTKPIRCVTKFLVL